MKNFKTQLIRIKGIAGMFYKVPGRNTHRIVIYGIGAPLPPDSGNLSDANHILDFDVDLFVPDYIGYGRSEGKFTPKNCIKTFLLLHKEFIKGCKTMNRYEQKTSELTYKELFFIGRSFGGAFVPLLPRYNNTIKNLCLLYPVVDPLTWIRHSDGDALTQEETSDDFIKTMIHDGYKYLYRGIMSKIWLNHFKNKDGLSPMENIKFLKKAKLFIGHGQNDIRINPIHSMKYHKMIINKFPERINQFMLRVYKNGDHSQKTSNKAVRDFLTWMRVPVGV